MAQRRLFSLKIVDSDAFLEMPTSSQALYFHLGMHSDDDGFVNPRKIMRVIGTTNDDLKILIAKRFILTFETGVVVIKHWLIHNTILKDRYTPTLYTEEKNSLIIKENGVYTENKVIEDNNVTKMLTQVKLSKVKLSKDNISSGASAPDEINPLIKLFEPLNPSFERLYPNKNQRLALGRLIKKHGLEKILELLIALPEILKKPYMPTITTPIQLEEKLGSLMQRWQHEQGKNKIIFNLIV